MKHKTKIFIMLFSRAAVNEDVIKKRLAQIDIIPFKRCHSWLLERTKEFWKGKMA